VQQNAALRARVTELEKAITDLHQTASEVQEINELLVSQLQRPGAPAPAIYPGLARVPDLKFYRASEHGDFMFSPWMGYGEFGTLLPRASAFSAISAERLWVLYTMAQQALQLDGDLVECGVWRGGSAILFSHLVHQPAVPEWRRLYLFDTFGGMPATNPEHDNYYKGGEFADTSLEAVRDRLPHLDRVQFRKGFIPQTFEGLEGLRPAFVHVDVDIHDSIAACCEFLYPRLIPGGIMIFDDYAWSTCAGARRAVDDYFASLPVRPLVLSNGQAIVFKSRE
jgi:O-methyltransferase